MKNLKAAVVLADIEGTTTSISFVKDVLFPYVRNNLKTFLDETQNQSDTQAVSSALMELDVYQKFVRECQDATTISSTKALTWFVNGLMDTDSKIGPLKALQGLVWAKGYETGTLKGHVYEDVPPAFQRWHERGVRIAIYSSGSIRAQKLLFGQSEQGNLLPYLSRHFDTAVGGKQERQSYDRIAEELEVSPGNILFLTDIVNEARAASAAGLQAIILDRPGNAPLTDDDKSEFIIIKDFNDLQVEIP